MRRRAVGRIKRIQFTPRLGHVVAQGCRRDARDDGAAASAGGIGALDAHEFRRARLEMLKDAWPVVAFAGEGGSSFGTSVNSSRQRLAGFGTPEDAKLSSGLNVCGSDTSVFAVLSACVNGSP